MKSNLTEHASVFSWILAILLCFSILAGSLSLVTKQTLLNPAFHRQIVKDQLIVNQINADVPALFFNIERSSDSTGQLAQLAKDTLGQLIWSVMPADWVAGQVEVLIQRGIDFIESGQESFAVTIDLTTIKLNMQAKTNELVNSVIQKMPTCTGKDVLGYMNYVLTGDNSSYPYCMPPKPFDKLVRTAIVNSFNLMTQKVPDNITVVTISLDNSALRPLATVLRIVRVMSLVARVAPYVILCLLLALVLINLKSLRIAIRGIGFAFLISGILILLVTLALYLYGTNFILNKTPEPSLIPLSPELIQGYLNAVFAGVEGMLWKMGAIIACGGLIVVLAVPRQRQKSPDDGSIAAV